MDLWVRSQNREILRINPELEIYEYGNTKFLVMDTKGYVDYGKAKILGEYKTKERALEVLDEIQKIIKQQLTFHIDKSQCNTIEDIANPKFIIRDVGIPRVYKMPKE